MKAAATVAIAYSAVAAPASERSRSTGRNRGRWSNGREWRNRGSRGASGSTLIARSGEGCAWRLGLAGSSDRQAMWVCTACRQAAYPRDGQAPNTCHRANPPRPL